MLMSVNYSNEQIPAGATPQWHLEYNEATLILKEKLPLISGELRFQCELGMAFMSLICYHASLKTGFLILGVHLKYSRLVNLVLKSLH